MRRVALATANRAERGILEPVIRRLRERKDIEFQLIENWAKWWKAPDQGEWMPDVILVPADRQEMVEVAMSCYYSRIPVFHMWAGIGATNTWDDLNRRVISSFSYLMLTEDDECRQRLIASGEEPWRCITTGTTHTDDLSLDMSKVPSEPYDLVLVNRNDPFEDFGELSSQAFKSAMTSGRHKVWIGPSDGNDAMGETPRLKYYATLPRPQFLALLKNAQRFISNSSAAVYEAPLLGTVVVPVGERNIERKTHFVEYPRIVDVAPWVPGDGMMMTAGMLEHARTYQCASDYIVDLLVNYPIDKSKLLKVYR